MHIDTSDEVSCCLSGCDQLQHPAFLLLPLRRMELTSYHQHHSTTTGWLLIHPAERAEGTTVWWEGRSWYLQ